MHQIPNSISAGLPRPRWGAYSAPPDPLAGFKGPTSMRRERREQEGWKGKGGEGRDRTGRGRKREV